MFFQEQNADGLAGDSRQGVTFPVTGADFAVLLEGIDDELAPALSPDGRWIAFNQSDTGLVLQPDSALYLVPAEGGKARRMRCNTGRMNSWHSWSPNSRWLVFASKAITPYTELLLTHVDAAGNDSFKTPPVRVDITTGGEESDPIADALGHTKRKAPLDASPATNEKVRRIEGDYSNVVGLPLPLTARLLTAAGVVVL